MIRLGDDLSILSNQMRRMRKERIGLDIDVKVHDKVFSAHRFILTLHSNFFETVFGSAFAEKDSPRIDSEHVTPEMFETILRLMYGEIISIMEFRTDILRNFICSLQFLQIRNITFHAKCSDESEYDKILFCTSYSGSLDILYMCMYDFVVFNKAPANLSEFLKDPSSEFEDYVHTVKFLNSDGKYMYSKLFLNQVVAFWLIHIIAERPIDYDLLEHKVWLDVINTGSGIYLKDDEKISDTQNEPQEVKQIQQGTEEAQDNDSTNEQIKFSYLGYMCNVLETVHNFSYILSFRYKSNSIPNRYPIDLFVYLIKDYIITTGRCDLSSFTELLKNCVLRFTGTNIPQKYTLSVQEIDKLNLWKTMSYPDVVPFVSNDLVEEEKCITDIFQRNEPFTAWIVNSQEYLMLIYFSVDRNKEKYYLLEFDSPAVRPEIKSIPADGDPKNIYIELNVNTFKIQINKYTLETRDKYDIEVSGILHVTDYRLILGTEIAKLFSK